MLDVIEEIEGERLEAGVFWSRYRSSRLGDGDRNSAVAARFDTTPFGDPSRDLRMHGKRRERACADRRHDQARQDRRCSGEVNRAAI
jgi:hypothetical protein